MRPCVCTVNCTATWTFRDKQQQQSRLFFRLNVYIDVENGEREKKQKRSILLEEKPENFIGMVRK